MDIYREGQQRPLFLLLFFANVHVSHLADTRFRDAYHMCASHKRRREIEIDRRRDEMTSLVKFKDKHIDWITNTKHPRVHAGSGN